MQLLEIDSPQVRGMLADLDRVETRLLSFVREVSPPDYYTDSTIKRMFFLSKQSFYNFIHRGWLKPVRIKGKRYFKREDVDQLLADNHFEAYRRGRWQPRYPVPEPVPDVHWEAENALAELEWVEKVIGEMVCSR